MRTPDEIRRIEFTKTAMGGYKQNEVDAFIDEIASQIETMALKMKDMDMRSRELEEKASTASASASGVEKLLIAAQKVADEVERSAKEEADKTVAAAEAKAAEIKEKCDRALIDTRAKLEQEKSQADDESAKVLGEAALKADAMLKAAKDSVAREQLLYDKIYTEIVALRKRLGEEIAGFGVLLRELPDKVPFDPERAAEAISFDANEKPDYKAILADSLQPSEPEADDGEPDAAVAADEPETVRDFDLLEER